MTLMAVAKKSLEICRLWPIYIWSCNAFQHEIVYMTMACAEPEIMAVVCSVISKTARFVENNIVHTVCISFPLSRFVRKIFSSDKYLVNYAQDAFRNACR
jgi:ABC-type sulfate transport system permease subunit